MAPRGTGEGPLESRRGSAPGGAPERCARAPDAARRRERAANAGRSLAHRHPSPSAGLSGRRSRAPPSRSRSRSSSPRLGDLHLPRVDVDAPPDDRLRTENVGRSLPRRPGLQQAILTVSDDFETESRASHGDHPCRRPPCFCIAAVAQPPKSSRNSQAGAAPPALKASCSPDGSAGDDGFHEFPPAPRGAEAGWQAETAACAAAELARALHSAPWTLKATAMHSPAAESPSRVTECESHDGLGRARPARATPQTRGTTTFGHFCHQRWRRPAGGDGRRRHGEARRGGPRPPGCCTRSCRKRSTSCS